MQREFYSLTKVAEMISCSVDDLIHLAGNGQIQLIVLPTGFNGLLLDQDHIPVTGVMEVIEDRYCFVSQDTVSKYQAGRASGQLYEDRIDSMLTNDNSGKYWNIPKSEAIILSGSSLFMLAKNIEALVTESHLKENHVITQTEREKLLKQIGSLAILLSKNSNNLQINGKVNALQIAIATEEMLSFLPDANIKGLSKSSFRASITEGLELLNK
jgi:hypothetical protein